MSRLRVGLNLVFLGERAGGIGRYARELLGTFARSHAADVELHAFVSRDAPAGLRDEPWASEVRWTTLPVGHSGPPLHLAAQFAAIPALALARRLDVVHSPANAGPVRMPRVASVITMHDLIWLHAGQDWETPEAVRSMWRVSVPTVRRADRVITDSDAGARDLVADLDVDAARLDVVPLGVRPPAAGRAVTPAAELRERLDLGDGPVVLCVAQKRRYKNQAALVRAVAALDDDRVRLVLPGAPTPYEAELAALAGELGCAHRVRLVDWISEADLEGLYALAACFVLPSLLEGFGLPVLEAMARGVPVACSDRASLPQVAGDAALLFDPSDQDAVSAAVARLLGDPAHAAELARRGRERVAQFSWERTAQGTLESYGRAIARRRG